MSANRLERHPLWPFIAYSARTSVSSAPRKIPKGRTLPIKKAASVLAMLVSMPIGAQSVSTAEPVEMALTAFDDGHYLEAIDGVAAVAFDATGKVKDDYAFQMWSQISPMVTNELDATILEKAAPAKPLDEDWANRISASASHSAIEEIVRRAHSTSIVILNEAHNSPRDRAFALQVARALRPLGYSVLAAEAFDNEPGNGQRLSAVDELKRDRFARVSTGFYLRDPVFAGFVREALALGYQPVSYEETSKQRPADGGIEAREEAQAENLMASRARFPNAKILIYVGHSHVAEVPLKGSSDGKIEWMAARLKRKSGVDPLTVDQASFSDLSPVTRLAYKLASSRIGDRPGVLFEGARPLTLGQYAGAVDLQVIHPRRTYRNGRPSWLAEFGHKQIAVPTRLRPITGRRLIQVYPASAPRSAVPFDQVMVQGGKPAGKLMVPKGPVRFTTQP